MSETTDELIPAYTDIVFVDTLRVSANIGPDCWGRRRAQPLEITVYLHLKDTYLDAAGKSDDVLDSVHYGHLTKSITSLIESQSENGFRSARELTWSVAGKAFELAGRAAEEVRVVLELPKMILLASGYTIDNTYATGDDGDDEHALSSKKVSVKDIILPVVIGVNPPERESKQRVVLNIDFFEKSGPKAVDYPSIVANLCQASDKSMPLHTFSLITFQEIEASSYLTLEKFVMQTVRSACLSSNGIETVTVRAQKPSALSFAQSSGVQITRNRKAFL
ncbi:hypothetical protein NLJ89_g5067 [Agrocybe chaxingu]|uniref:dihydroneopterin aldolase n=1 Tax=Agrocybe chaxingu TaxID=84603 RepID=A0A9W8MVC7_9AGAR|nr:hypothetical protein NLJ89_g5067 [Agrocybe chaxingu]